MDWEALAELVAPAAPTLGKVIGGALPIPFGSSIGQTVGGLIASAVGAPPQPDAVAAAIKATPADVLKAQLSDLETSAASQYAALAAQAQAQASIGQAQVAATAATVQAELVQGTWYQRAWRPTAMFVWVATWPIQLGTILWQIGTKDPAVINNLATVIGALAAWNAAPAGLAGVYSWNRSQEKIAALGNGH